MSRTSDETRDGSMGSARATPAARAEPPLFSDESMIGARYRLIRLIARGGMGEVYEAEDLELGGRIAIKTIRAERIGDPSAVSRLKLEIQAARKVTHPNVVRLFDVGFHVLADQREVAFITMELLDGETLDVRIRRSGRLAVSEALDLARQMATALDAAHAAKVIHRDFKSQNVILVGDRAIVTDFGLACGDDHEGSGTTTVEFVGTPAYMAPEQVTRARVVGTPADIYAFGVVLFEMVTGQWPFRCETPLATAAARITSDPPSPRTIVPDLPVSWESTILRCLRREPARRFTRAGEVVAALTRRPTRWQRWAIVAAGVVGMIAAGVAIANRADAPSAAPVTAPSRCSPAELPDIFVDAAAPPGGTGSRECPLRAITDALAIAGDRRIIHVGAGFYDKEHGERFPLELRGDVALRGAGADRTSIVGVGAWDPSATGGTPSYTRWQVSIVTGDATRSIEITDVAIASGLPSVQGDVAGIMCTRGAIDAPNTRLRRVVVGPSYGVGIVVGTETIPAGTGCNLDLADSRLHDGTVGVFQLGCGLGEGRNPVGLAVHSTTFEAFRKTDSVFPGAGIVAYDCIRSLTVEGSTFGDSDQGIGLIRHKGEPGGPVVIENNRFAELSRIGISAALSVEATLRGNTLSNIGGIGDSSGRGAAVRVLLTDGDAPVLIARDNRLEESDVGLEVTGYSLDGRGPIAAAARIDFGRPGDPGGNVFRCNAAPEVAPVTGHDVAIRLPAARGARLDLAGNRWDHMPPTRSTRATNGLDILAVAGSPLEIVTDAAAAHDIGCDGRRR